MSVNLDKVSLWKQDIADSVDFFNKWFLEFAPKTFRETRDKSIQQVEAALKLTDNLRNIQPDVLMKNPSVLPILRMSTCPPLARDRLIGLADINPSLVDTMESKNQIPSKMTTDELESQLNRIIQLITKLIDDYIYVWLERDDPETDAEVYRASTIVADRLSGSLTDPIVRNEQERRQLGAIKSWLESRGYREVNAKKDGISSFDKMPNGTFAFRLNVPVYNEKGKKVNIPVDAVIMRKNTPVGGFPLLFEAKSAGDFTNVNKRRKEESKKIAQLKDTYGKNNISFNLFLCGYFNAGYLGYEGADGIDWAWEHRIDDLEKFGI
jgi:hypothetical protein